MSQPTRRQGEPACGSERSAHSLDAQSFLTTQLLVPCDYYSEGTAYASGLEISTATDSAERVSSCSLVE